MPLSEQEQRLLEEMERNLYHNDADFVATVGGRRGRPNYTTIVLGALIGILGIATLIVGVVVHLTVVGIVGFAVMFAGVLLAIAPPRQSMRNARPSAAGKPSTAPKQKSSSFMQGLNDRWEKRQDDRGN